MRRRFEPCPKTAVKAGPGLLHQIGSGQTVSCLAPEFRMAVDACSTREEEAILEGHLVLQEERIDVDRFVEIPFAFPGPFLKGVAACQDVSFERIEVGLELDVGQPTLDQEVVESRVWVASSQVLVCNAEGKTLVQPLTDRFFDLERHIDRISLLNVVGVVGRPHAKREAVHIGLSPKGTHRQVRAAVLQELEAEPAGGREVLVAVLFVISGILAGGGDAVGPLMRQ